MTCNMAERLISAYIDHELSEDDRNRVRQHLAVCASCMATYTATLEVKRALSSMTPAQCPECVWEDIERQIRLIPFQRDASQDRSARPAWSFVKLVIPAAVAGTLIAIPLVQALLGISFFGTPDRSQPPALSSAPSSTLELAYPNVQVRTAGTSRSGDALEEILGDDIWLLQPVPSPGSAARASQSSLRLRDAYEDYLMETAVPGWRYGR
ncbi:MAG: anti-sigma factor family protein [Bacillota bacterium]